LYKLLRGLSLGGVLSRRSFKSSPLGVLFVKVTVVNISRVPEGLINFLVFGGFQGFSFSFSPIVFIPDVVSEMLKVF